MTDHSEVQIFALLFCEDARVSAAADFGLRQTELEVPNTQLGLVRMLDWMAEHFDRTRQPLLCCSAAPGAVVDGLIFEELIASEQVPRFLMAQPFYLHFAATSGHDPNSPFTLLRAAKQHSPRPQ